MRAPITLFVPGLEGGGAQRVFTTLANSLVDVTDHPVHMVLVRRGGVFRDHLRPEVNVFDLDTGRVSRAIPRLARYLRSTQPVVLCSTLNYCNVIAVCAWVIAGRPCRLVLREANVATSATRKMRFLMRMTYPRADCVVALSPEVKDHLLQAGIPVGPKTVEIGNPIALNSSEAVRGPLDFLPIPNPSFICAVGSLSHQKGFDLLINAFSQLNNHEVHLVILGEGTMREELEAQCRDLNLTERVHLPGFVETPRDVVRRAQLFVLSSRFEGFPNVLLEALSTGTPIVATDCPGAPRSMLEDGELGHLVKPDDAEALSVGLMAALKAPRGTPEARMARAEDFAADKIAQLYLNRAFCI